MTAFVAEITNQIIKISKIELHFCISNSSNALLAQSTSYYRRNLHSIFYTKVTFCKPTVKVKQNDMLYFIHSINLILQFILFSLSIYIHFNKSLTIYVGFYFKYNLFFRHSLNTISICCMQSEPCLVLITEKQFGNQVASGSLYI